MSFLKKAVFGFAALFFILVGGAGTQSDSTLLQGGGFLGLIIGLIVLYIFAKMAWRAIGCLPSLIVILAVVASKKYLPFHRLLLLVLSTPDRLCQIRQTPPPRARFQCHTMCC